jgi:tetratricopeptide (TPR) repeat protein
MDNMDIYGTCLWHLRKDVDLGFLAKELEDLDPHAPQTWCVVGNLFSRTLEHDQAIKSFQRAVECDPHFAYAHTLMGHEYMLNEDLDRAATSFRSAIRAHSRHYNSWCVSLAFRLICVFMAIPGQVWTRSRVYETRKVPFSRVPLQKGPRDSPVKLPSSITRRNGRSKRLESVG